MNRPFAVPFLLLLYGGAGVTALCYEILWARMLSLMFGVSIMGVAATVVAFMAGLGLGSLASSRRQCSAGRSLMWVGLLEGGVALWALALPSMMAVLDGWLVAHASDAGSWRAWQAAATVLALLPAATAMGVAFPLALCGARAFGVGLGAMYGVNALGGALGALLPLGLLPAFGWRTSVWLTAGLGAALAAGFVALAARADAGAAGAASRGSAEHRLAPGWIDLGAYALVGAAALMLEMAWTRLFGMVLLRTEYVLGVLLATWLAGIGLGSLWAARLDATAARRWLGWLPFAAAGAAVLGLYLLPAVARQVAQAAFPSLTVAMAAEGAAVMLLTLPATLALGAWLPLLARASSIEGSGGWWYGANSLGAAIGAALAVVFLIPRLGAPGVLILAGLLLWFAGWRWPGGIATGRRLAAGLALMALAWPVRALPPVAALLPELVDARDLRVHEDAVSLTHVVERADGTRLLLSDLQRMDASSEPTAVTVQKNQARLPLLLHPNPRSVLFLGLGTGVTAAGSLPFPSLRERVAVELAEGAILAARNEFAPVNGGVMRRIRIVHDDARRFLRAERRGFDVIVGDLFHPDMAGRANLLSVQQFRRVRARLAPGGVFAQWVALNQFDPEGLAVVMRSFARVFPDGMVFVDGYRLALVGVAGRRPAGASALGHAAGIEPLALRAATGGEGVLTWLGRFWGLARDAAGRGDALQDEWRPVLEYRLPRLRHGAGVDLRANWRWMLGWRMADATAARILGLDDAARVEWRQARLATALNVRRWMLELAGGDDREAVRLARMALRLNPRDRWAGFALADRMFASLSHGLPPGMDRRQALTRVLELRPDHVGALRAMLELARSRGDAAAARRWAERLARLDPLARPGMAE
ncbi:MAG: fused MFS/spermidine synthase [Mariprofundaceae bacterium]